MDMRATLAAFRSRATVAAESGETAFGATESVAAGVVAGGVVAAGFVAEAAADGFGAARIVNTPGKDPVEPGGHILPSEPELTDA
jgi:hypothetical protein